MIFFIQQPNDLLLKRVGQIAVLVQQFLESEQSGIARLAYRLDYTNVTI